jgi:hypothetical protein
MKQFTVAETDAYRLIVKIKKCANPKNLNSLDFTQETITNGVTSTTSTYNFFLTDEEVKVLAQGLQ